MTTNNQVCPTCLRGHLLKAGSEAHGMRWFACNNINCQTPVLMKTSDGSIVRIGKP